MAAAKCRVIIGGSAFRQASTQARKLAAHPARASCLSPGATQFSPPVEAGERLYSLFF